MCTGQHHIRRILPVLITTIALGLGLGLGLGLLLIAGACSADRHADINAQLNAGGITLGMKQAAVQDKLGAADPVPCVSGYELLYPDAGLTIGFDNDRGTVRRVTMQTDAYDFGGITVGESVPDGVSAARTAGWTPEEGFKSQLLKDDYRLILKSIKGETIDEITIEHRL
ncbi:MAG: hypothetical protein LBS17_01780 [Actinomycetes bacterium]|jgi:hypothetical protein|nr:hypothetical protein [Actinomycetes bacterium]